MRPACAGRPLRVADVALFYGERSGGIRTYLDEKVAWAAEGAVEHHLVVPGRRERHEHSGGGMRHELRSLRVAASNGYRWPLGAQALKATLRAIRADVVLLHDPFWHPLDVTSAIQAAGGRVVMVHHGSVDLDAHAFPGAPELYARALRRWMHRAYARADAVMAACDPWSDAGRAATMPLRFGLHPAFRPRPEVVRGDHVLYVGRLAREKGVLDLLDAAARSAEPWPLALVGTGTAGEAIAARARRLGLGDRVSFSPYVTGREALARAYARASAVVMPGRYETFGLVAYEAAASGASTVACANAPSAAVIGPLARTFPPGDAAGLLAAIEAARAAEPDEAAAAAFAARHRWPGAFAAELADLRALVAGAVGRPGVAQADVA